MKYRIAILCVGLALAACAADSSAKKQSKKTTAAKTAPARDPMLDKLPAGAKLVAPQEWEYTDAQGKKWIYRRTPFTLAKLPAAEYAEAPKETAADRAAMDSTNVTDLGESLQFTRPGPFGMLKWTAKKSQLDAFETKVWEREQRKKEQTASAGVSAPAANEE